MATEKFTDLPVATSLDGTEIVAVVQPGNTTGTSKRATVSQISTQMNQSGPFVMVGTATLGTAQRTLAGQASVVTITDNGSGSTVSVGIATAGITNIKLAAMATGTIKGSTSGTATDLSTLPFIASVAVGGSGQSSLTAHGIVIGNGASAVSVSSTQSAGQLLVGQNATSDPLWMTVGGDAALTLNGTLTIATSAVTFAKIQTATPVSVLGVAGNATAVLAPISTASGNQALLTNAAGTGVVWGLVPLGALAQRSGLTVLGNPNSTTGPVSEITGTANQVLRVDSNGSTLGFGTISLIATGSPTSVLGVAGNATASVASIASSAGSQFLKTNTANTTLSFTALTAATMTSFTTAGSGTFNVTTGCLYLVVEVQGAGGGGSGSGAAGTNGSGTAGSDSSFGTAVMTGSGGGPGLPAGASGGGGAASGGDFIRNGGKGGEGPGINATASPGGIGGSSLFGGIGPPNAGDIGGAGVYGAGGAGGGTGLTGVNPGAGGGGGGYARKLIGSPNTSYTYIVGAGGNPGIAGTNGFTGGTGSAGVVIITQHFQ